MQILSDCSYGSYMLDNCRSIIKSFLDEINKIKYKIKPEDNNHNKSNIRQNSYD